MAEDLQSRNYTGLYMQVRFEAARVFLLARVMVSDSRWWPSPNTLSESSLEWSHEEGPSVCLRLRTVQFGREPWVWN